MTESDLGRLYKYAKGDLQVALENFTTETLRIAIKEDPVPMLEALATLQPAWAAEHGLRRLKWRARSQVQLPPSGWLDLVIEVLDNGSRVQAEVWIEVKIGAGESGDQLDFYLAQSLLRGRPVLVMTLAKHPVRSCVPNLTWSVLYQKARRGRPDSRSWQQHPGWKDFCLFLEEEHVTNDELGPITDLEAASLGPAHQLIGKVGEVVKTVQTRVTTMIPELSKTKYADDAKLVNSLAIRFVSNGEMIGANGPLGYGLMWEDGTAYWKMALDAGLGNFTISQTDARRKVAAEAAPTLGDGWISPPAGRTLLVTRVRAAALESHEAVLRWMDLRLEELANSGLLGRITSTLAAQAPGVPSAGELA